MSCWFFFSYAHLDHDDFLGRFYEDLAKEVKRLKGPTALESGFLDRTNIEHGASWDKTLEKGLTSCRVFVPIYSASYFLSEYSGKEFQVFRQRVHAGFGGNDVLILPVLLGPESNVLPKIPACIDKISYTHGSYPPEYVSEGLLQLIRLGVAPNAKYYNQYWEFVRKFATAIVDAADKYPLAESPSLTPLDQVHSLFPPAARAAGASTRGDGPRYVQFIFVVGKDSELRAAQRQELKFYGKGAADWKPYLDTYQDTVASLAIQAVSETAKNLDYEELALSDHLLTHIHEASQNNRIVVVILDTWTLRLKSYRQLIQPLDNYSSVNCVTFVLANDDDQEAATFKSILDAAVNGTFSNKVSLKDSNFFPAVNFAGFKTQLVGALTRAQARIIETSEVRKKLSYASVQSAQTNEFETKPSL